MCSSREGDKNDKAPWRCQRGVPRVRVACQPGVLEVKERVETGENAPWDGSWEHRPARGAALPSTTTAARSGVDDGPWRCASRQAPTANGSRAFSECSPGGARAAACSSPLTTRIVAGGITTVRSRMGAPQRGQETLSSWKILHNKAAQASHAGCGPSAGSLVSRMRRCSGVASTGGAGTISLRQAWLGAKTP